MKTVLLAVSLTLAIVLSVFSTPTTVQAEQVSVNFAWAANDPTENISGYKLYMDQTTNSMNTIADGSVTSHILSFEDNGTAHTFTLTAYRDSYIDSNGVQYPYIESEHTNSVIYIPKVVMALPISAVKSLTIEITQ